MENKIEISVLGTVQVRGNGRPPVDLGGPRLRRLLAALVIAEGKVVATDTLIERLWTDDERPTHASGRRENVTFDTTNGRFVFTDPVTLLPTRPPVAVSAAGAGGGQTISPDGRWFVVNSRGGTQLYVAASAEAVGPPMPAAANVTTGTPTFNADGTSIGVPRAEGGSYMWQVDPALWQQRACEIAGRNLNEREWARYVPIGGPRRKACEQ